MSETFVRQYHFPPFPPPPDGVNIIPFKDFTPYGTRVVRAGEGEVKAEVERDGLGIPTIALPKKKEKGEKKVVKLKNVDGTLKKQEWWEEWEASGQPVRGVYDPKLNRVDRFYQAATEFHKHYKIHSYHQHLQVLWDTFRSYAGLAALAGAKSIQAAEEELSDDEIEDDGDIGETAFVPQAQAVTETPQLDTDTLVQPQKEDKIAAFLNNPVEAFKVFLSSYMYNQGQVWDRRKLVSAPHLLRFLVNFLLVNRVLPESVQGLQDALKAIDVAQRELPRTCDISDTLPDAFSVACQGHWGQKAGAFLAWDLDEDEAKESEGDGGEPKAKRAKLNHDGDDGEKPPVTDIADVNGGWGGNSGWGESVGEKSGGSQDVDMPASTDGGWDTGGGWGDAAWGTSDAVANDPPQLLAEPQIPPRPTLVTLLGPTSLPLTHAPGIVEWSLRRIKSVSPPPGLLPPTDGAEAVERGLEARMHRMVLEPWVGPNAAADPPHILRSSNGPLAPAVAASPDQPKPHDVLKDEITVLVEGGAAEVLCVGMGLIGTWVQLARVQDQDLGGGETNDVVPEVKKNLTKGQKARRGLRYWYIDELVLVVPSYWAV
ncbi:hypothetical protein B0H12DRAFT_1138692 [Mycena haematopus]|nr:hypothetical protein B0H12DRAFT_1138692 [Mycena haematopus]